MDQLHLRLRLPATERGEELPEVKLLSSVRHINDLVGIPRRQPILQRGQIRRGVIGRPVAFLTLDVVLAAMPTAK